MTTLRSAAVAAIWFAMQVAEPTHAADAMISGCNQRNVGEIGVRELVGNLGEQISVAVTIHANSEIDSFGLRLNYPTHLLQFVEVRRAILTENFFFFGGSPVGDTIQISGSTLDTGEVSSGSMGQAALVIFEVVAAGTGAFSTGDYVDDLVTYRACEATNSPTPVEASSWGSVKARYE